MGIMFTQMPTFTLIGAGTVLITIRSRDELELGGPPPHTHTSKKECKGFFLLLQLMIVPKHKAGEEKGNTCIKPSQSISKQASFHNPTNFQQICLFSKI